jgi:hypothetical protein
MAILKQQKGTWLRLVAFGGFVSRSGTFVVRGLLIVVCFWVLGRVGACEAEKKIAVGR